MRESKVGNTVKVYKDPMTEKNFESNAELVRLIRPRNQAGFEIWIVRLHGEDDHCQRWIKSK